eukprot:jgi/Chrzof1/5811/Cz16g16210.t1
MLKPSEEQLQQLKQTGWLREVAFRTQPRVNKIEIKNFLQTVYGLPVKRVSTINYLGKKKTVIDSNGKQQHYRLPDWKKAYVIFAHPSEDDPQAKQKPREPLLPHPRMRTPYAGTQK